MQDARDDELAVDELADVLDRRAVEHRVGELDGDLRGELLLVRKGREPLILLLELHVQGVADEDHREDDAHDAQRVGHGIAQGDGRVVVARGVGIGLLRGAESRGVRHGAREDADHRRDGGAGRQVDDVGHRHAQQHDGRGAADEREPTVLERGEESRSDLQTDRKDEEDESEFLHELPDLAVDRHAEVAHCDADEEDPRDAERDTADPDLAQQDAERDDQCENQDGMCDAAAEEQGMQPLHNDLLFCVR